MSRIIQLRRDASTSWTAVNPTLTQGEFGYETDTNKFKIGNGVDDWNTLGYLFQGEDGGTVSYDDLSDLPTLFDGAYSSLTGTPTLATVATSGAYTDLSGTPTLATVATSGAYTDLSGTPTLATVATSGAYADITGTPSIPSTIGGTFQAVASGALANGDKVVLNSDGTVSVGSESPVPTPNTTSIGPASTIHTQSYVSENGAVLTSLIGTDKFVFTYADAANGGYDTFVVGTISGNNISFGTPVVFQSAYYSVGIDIVAISSTQIVVSHTTGVGRNSSDAAQLSIGTVSGSSITFSSPTTVPQTGSTANPSFDRSGFPAGSMSIMYDPGENKLIHLFKHVSLPGYNNSQGHLYPLSATVCTVNGSSFSFGSFTNILAGVQPMDGTVRSVYDPTSAKTIITFGEQQADGTIDAKAKFLTISGTTVSESSGFTAFEDTGGSPVTIALADDKVVLGTRLSSDNFNGYLKVGIISGNSITFGGDTDNVRITDEDSNFSGDIQAFPPLTYDSNLDRVLAFYKQSGEQGRIAALTISGTDITFDNSVQVLTGSSGAFSQLVWISNTGKALLEYSDQSTTPHAAKIVTVTASESILVSNVNAENYVGISDGAYSNGATATIQTAGAVDDAQSGLTAGQAYYLQGDGTLSTTADDPSVFAGVALSSTEILIAKNDSGGGVSNYNDLTNLPTLFDGAYSSLTGAPTLATVATSGSYTDLTGTPSIPSVLTDIGITDGTANQVLTTDGSGSFTFTDAASSYGNTEVDTHLNTGSASVNQILSWNGSDYTWVADQITSVGTSTVIAPFALANVDGTSGSGTGISYGSWNSGSGTLTFTFSSAQSDSNYIVMTDGEFTDDGRLASVSNKSTTGFQVSFYDSNGNTVTPSSFSRFAVVVYGSTPTTTVIGSGTSDVVDDTSPQLGGSLDVNGNDIVSTSNGNIDLDPDGSGNVIFKGNNTRGSGAFKLNCENNSHGITIKGPPHSANADYTLTLPNDDGSANQVLTTDGSGELSWSTAGGGAWSLFSSTTVTSAVSQIDMSLSSSYSTYMIVVDNLDPCGALYFRWKRGGSFITAGEYNYTETKTSITQRYDQSRFKIAGFTDTNHASAVIYLNNINNTDGPNPSLFSQAVEEGRQCIIAGNNSSNISGAVTDIRLYFDSNPTSGSVYIYRLQTS